MIILFYLTAGVFNALMIFIGVTARISAESFLPAIAGVLFAVAGILEEIEKLRLKSRIKKKVQSSDRNR